MLRYRRWLLAIGYWQLGIGNWVLVIGYWVFAIGYWILVDIKNELEIQLIFYTLASRL